MAVLSMARLRGRSSNYGAITDYEQEVEYLAHTDSKYETDYSIFSYGIGSGLLPIPYVTYSDSVNPLISLLCRGLSVRQDAKSPFHYVITAKWSSAPLSQAEKDTQQAENPLDRPSKISWGSSKYNKPCVFDKNNALILNSAGEPFDPPAEFDQSRWTFKVTKNVAFVPNFILDYTDGVNSGDFTIQGLTVGARKCKIMSIELSDEQVEQIGGTAVSYFVFSFSGELRKEKWDLQLLDQGYRQKDPNDSTKRIAIKDDGVPAKFVTKPWPLDGSGGKLANPSTSNAVTKVFKVYNEVDYGVLPGINGNP